MDEDFERMRLIDAAEELVELVENSSDYLRVSGLLTFPFSDKNEATFLVASGAWGWQGGRHIRNYRVTITPEIPELGNEEKGENDA